MKRNSIIFILISIFLLATVIVSAGCDIQLKENAEAPAPEVNQTEGGIVLTINQQAASYAYINVYRRDVTDVEEKRWDKITEYEKIGIVYPKNFSKNAKSYTYEDLYVYKDKTYQYCVRYASESQVVPKLRSAWSAAISPKTTSGKNPDVTFTYTPEDVLYDESNQTLNFRANITIQDVIRDFEPMLAVKTTTENVSQIFALPESVKSGTTLLNTKMQLVSILSDQFLYTDTNPVEIEILGILGQKVNYDRNLKEDEDISALKILSVTWTPITPLTIKDNEGNVLKTFKITSPTGQVGYDWSDLD